MDFTHLTDRQSDSGVWHLWTYGDDRGSVSLAALMTRDHGIGRVAELSPSAAPLVAVVDGGAWVFDVIQTHTPNLTGWAPCRVHGVCEVDAIVSSIAEPAWRRITTAGVTDLPVRVELEKLHDLVFAEVA